MRYLVFDLLAVFFIILAAILALRNGSGYEQYAYAVISVWAGIAMLVGKAYCKNKDKQS